MNPSQDIPGQLLTALEAWAPEPSAGLPESLFLLVSRLTPLVNVDLLVQVERRGTLLTWREDEFYGAGWHVPGGIIRYKETAEDCIRATAQRELGASVEFDPQPVAVIQAIEPRRRERGHFISLLYRCRLTAPPAEALRFTGAAPQRGQWAWHAHCPPDLIPAQAPYRRFLTPGEPTGKPIS
jgi:ADP-ribose pyrophosphatase YjhB (NUDIX family)